MSKEISFDRLRELQLAERTLNALESHGVDNWEGYSEAIAEVNQKAKTEQARLDILDEIMEVLAEGVDYPVGREVGACFTDKAIEAAQMIILGADLK